MNDSQELDEDGLPPGYLVAPCSQFDPEPAWPAMCSNCGFGIKRHRAAPVKAGETQ